MFTSPHLVIQGDVGPPGPHGEKGERVSRSTVINVKVIGRNILLQGHDGVSGAKGPPGEPGPIVRISPTL